MSDLDLGTHYVRTPAGAAKYKRPIGAPIGPWPDHRAPSVHVGAVKSEVGTLKTGHLIRKGLKELPDTERNAAVRDLREALRGRKDGLSGVSNQALLRIAIDPKQHGRIRVEAKKELARRVQDKAATHKLHRQAAIKAMRAGESPNHFLGIDGPELTHFQKALIEANPKYGNRFVKLLQRLHTTPTFKKIAAGRKEAAKLAREHVKHTKTSAGHKAVNMVALGVGAAIASHVMNGLGMDPAEPIKAAVEWMKEAAL